MWRTDYSDAWDFDPQHHPSLAQSPQSRHEEDLSQRNPVLAVLLLAATLALDAVAITWLARAGVESAAAYLYDALVSAQLALACLWAVFAAKRIVRGWLAIIGAVAIATICEMRLTGESFPEAAATYLFYAVLLSIALWVLKRSSLWQRISVTKTSVWHYSTALLLAMTTAVAVLIVLVRKSGILFDAMPTWRLIAILTAGDVLLVLATVVLWARRSILPMRLAAVCATAIAIGFIEVACGVSGALGTELTKVLQQEWPAQFSAYALIMSLTIFIWLELVPIVPSSRDAGAPSANDQHRE
jgi:hypothetical protein